MCNNINIQQLLIEMRCRKYSKADSVYQSLPKDKKLACTFMQKVDAKLQTMIEGYIF